MTKHSTPKKSPHSKRTRTTSPSGWTHITKGPPSHLPPNHTTALQHYHSTSPSDLTPLENYISRFKKWYIPQWKASTCYQNLAQLFIDEIIPSTHNNRVTNCICLGLGSFTSSSTSSNSSSSWQLAALLSLLELLHTSSFPNNDNNDYNDPSKNKTFPIIFQDPIFNATDEVFLTTYLPPLLLTSTNNNHPVTVTVTVVEDPHAFERIDEGTFLFAPHLECGIFAKALGGEGEGPVVCVGSDVGEYEDGLLAKHAEEARAGSVEVFKRFREEREEREMPGFERGDWCVALRVYWRNGKGEGRDEGEGGEDVEEMVRVLEGQRL